MKAALIGIVWLMTTPALAASVTVPDESTILPDVAQTTTAVLLDAGLPARAIGGGKYVVQTKGFHCDQRSRGPFDAADPVAGLPTVKCRINAKNIRDTKSGTPFAEARVMNELLLKVQQAGGGGDNAVGFNDCALGGYCGTFAAIIRCVIDTKVESFNGGGRWICTYVDGNGPIEPK